MCLPFSVFFMNYTPWVITFSFFHFLMFTFHCDAPILYNLYTQLEKHFEERSVKEQLLV